ncbi:MULTISPECIES: SDR family oxidoreductase [Mycobacterium avium complex (MAC)]|uniref:SDR family oxidoreductase n=1 Tax=Mycobacterium avium complex (MAC) TaxID=120793 RepID=UPI000449B4CD|nr:MULTISPECIES: NAD(P)-dependent oxidoreductase [Mycobacterium avium complex (MAC)]ETZ38847.1 short chain dehydrogenase family protein [Mycobacterium intracellulare MIN_061107_1834]MCA2272152.1 NAD(P)-dependent oxidoreductase [Mycobacterium intracellulare]MCA2323825.1 NAD(P)-dependent oxidoreductase [Mycobacterium intracellulare]UEB24169.1 NAD(P)-dependent oxidoreductase [Mycobacterium intracellulare]WVL48679.1 NAD(P)-dependent oxidoreductase [Mycobacterium paraintracellulare]
MADNVLTDRTVVISGGSRGIGLAIGIAAARQGANVVLLAKTDTPHPRLPGTVHTAAADVESAGGKALAVVGDVRREEDVQRAVDAAVQRFGGIDICVNNASAIATDPTAVLSAKKYDLMQEINLRGTFLLTKACVPHLQKSANPHVLTISPPLNMNPRWLGAHPAYTLSKYGMTLLSLGWAAEFADDGIGVNCLWPETYIATAAVTNMADGDRLAASSRSPEIMGDAAVEIVSRPAREATGQCHIDAEVLRSAGVADLSRYGGGEQPIPDLFLD